VTLAAFEPIGPMRRRNNFLFGVVNSTLLGGVATVMTMLCSTLTGAGLRWYTASVLGGIIGSFVSYFLFRH
jgi:hypothetical protein